MRAEDYLDKISLVDSIGCRLFYDENGRPGLISIGHSGYTPQNDRLRDGRMRRFAQQMAENAANAFMTETLNINLSVHEVANSGRDEAENIVFTENKGSVEKAREEIDNYVKRSAKNSKGFAAASMAGRSVIYQKVLPHPETKQKVAVCAVLWSVRSSSGNTRLLSQAEADMFVQGIQKTAAFASKGRINGYRVLSNKKSADGPGYDVTVEVDVAKYTPPGRDPDSRRRMAVLPFDTNGDDFKLGNKRFSARMTAQKFAEKLNDSISQTRRFTVLDRRSDKVMDRELERVYQESARPDDIARLGHKLTADYIITGDLRLMDDPTDADNRNDYVKMRLNFRILMVATTELKWSGTVEVPVSAAQGDTEDECLENLLMEGARMVQIQIVESIHPIRLASIIDTDKKNPRYILNRGGDSIRAGDLFELCQQGKEILDPQTGELLEREETVLATVKIVKTGPKTSHAVLAEGTTQVPKIEDSTTVIARRVKPAKADVSRVTAESGKRSDLPAAKSRAGDLRDIQRAHYTPIEQALVKMRSGNYSKESLERIYKMRKDVPTGEIRLLVEKVVAAALVSLGEYKAYNAIRKNISGVQMFEERMKANCESCEGNGEGLRICKECGGRGKCSACSGLGYRTVTSSRTFVSQKAACFKCKDSDGKCVRCEGKGKERGECRKCRGTGKMVSPGAAGELAVGLIKEVLEAFTEYRQMSEKREAGVQSSAPTERQR